METFAVSKSEVHCEWCCDLTVSKPKALKNDLSEASKVNEEEESIF